MNVPIDEEYDLMASDDHIAAESTFDLDRLLSALPAKMREAIELVKIQGHSVADTSRRLSITESDVKISIHRGLRKLAENIAQGRRQ